MSFPQFLLLLLFSHYIVSESLRPHGLQHTRLFCPPLSPRVCSNSCPLRQWNYLTILSSPNPFSFFLQSFPASGFFPMSQHFASSGQNTGASTSASVFPMNIQGSSQSKELSRVFSSTGVQKNQFFSAQPSLWTTSPICTWLSEKP